MRSRKFGFPRRPQIVPDLWPRLQTSPPDDPEKLRSQVLGRVPVLCDDELRTFRGFIERRFQVRTQFREQRNDPFALPVQMFQFRTWHAQAVALPVHIRPAQGERLRRGSESAKACQDESRSNSVISYVSTTDRPRLASAFRNGRGALAASGSWSWC